MNTNNLLACLIVAASFFATGVLAKGGGPEVARCQGNRTDCVENCDVKKVEKSAAHSDCTTECNKNYYKCLFEIQKESQK